MKALASPLPGPLYSALCKGKGPDMRDLPPDYNVVLIGMPGCGKSTIGILLAKSMSRSFVDTDVVIQSREGKTLHQIALSAGREGFRDVECAAICSLEARRAIISTGGSVVYRTAAMEHLRDFGVVVFMDVSLAVLEKRLGDLDARGVSRNPGQTLESLMAERRPLYEAYADITIDLSDLNHDQAEAAVRQAALRFVWSE
jgi:shikimate kinase